MTLGAGEAEEASCARIIRRSNLLEEGGEWAILNRISSLRSDEEKARLKESQKGPEETKKLVFI